MNNNVVIGNYVKNDHSKTNVKIGQFKTFRVFSKTKANLRIIFAQVCSEKYGESESIVSTNVDFSLGHKLPSL